MARMKKLYEKCYVPCHLDDLVVEQTLFLTSFANGIKNDITSSETHNGMPA